MTIDYAQGLLFIAIGVAFIFVGTSIISDMSGIRFMGLVCFLPAILFILAGFAFMLPATIEKETYTISGSIDHDTSAETISFLTVSETGTKERKTLPTASDVKESHKPSKDGKTTITLTIAKRKHLEEKVTTIVIYEPEEPSEQGTTDDKSGAIKRHKLEKEYDYLSYLIESKATLTEEEFERVQAYNRDIATYDGLKPITLDGLTK